jgi:hypothetical protein
MSSPSSNAGKLLVLLAVALLLVPLAAHADIPPDIEDGLTKLGKLPGARLISSLILIGAFAAGIRVATLILGISGSFWRALTAAAIAFTATMLLDPIFHVSSSALVSFIIGTTATTLAIYLLMETSLGQALVCSMLSSVFSIMLVMFIAVPIGLQYLPG